MTSTTDDQEADQALRDARSRFVAGYSQRHAAMGTLLANCIEADDPASLKSLRDAAHKIAGLAGVLGFPTVSEHASALEIALLQPSINPDDTRSALAQMGAGFAHDLSGAAPSWAQDASPAAAGARVLIVEDEQEQRLLIAAGLRAAGYRVVTAESGMQAVSTARAERPDLILLDIDMPGMDGMAVCRQLKLEPVLSEIPVMFCSARTSGMDRMAGLTLGADDYIAKPVVPGELLVRMRRLLARKTSESAAGAIQTRALPYELFASSAKDHLSRSTAAIALIRLAPGDVERVTARLLEELRRKDLVGQFSDGHLIALLPAATAPEATLVLRGILDAITPPLQTATIGAAANDAAGAPLDALIEDADLALARNRVEQTGGLPGQTTILLADDDPDVLHIIDTRLRAAGYRTLIAVDGQQALDTIEQESPAVLLLDLMMPKITGFEILTRLRERAIRPRTIVVSARGRDEDVTRAFDLGADDYLNKPFNPEELVARIARLIR